MKSEFDDDFGEPIALSPDFAQGVLVEAKARRVTSRRRRAVSVGAVLSVGLAVVLARPIRQRHASAPPNAAALLALGDVTSEDIDFAADADADADPDSYLVPGADGQTDDGEDADLALFGQE
jgi:hypothetical protein